MSCVLAVFVSTFHTVHVVSMDDVTISDGSVSFQSNEVSGAQKSVCLTCVCESGSRGRREKTFVNDAIVFYFDFAYSNNYNDKDIHSLTRIS